MNGFIAGVTAKRRFQQRDSGPLQPGDVGRQRPSESTVVQIHQSDSGPLQPDDVGRQRPSESTVVQQIHHSDSGPLQPGDVGRQRGQRKRKMTDSQLALQKKQKDVLVEVQKKISRGKRQGRKRKGTVRRAKQPKADYHCLICGEDFVDPPTETWLQCQSCYGWCHAECTEDGNAVESFVCDFCA